MQRKYSHKILYRECDMMRVVNNAVYVHWMEDARVDALAQIGCDYRDMEDKGYAGPVMSLSVKYISAAKFGETVDIYVSFDKYTGARLILSYQIKESGTDRLIATATSEHCFVNIDTGAPTLIKSIFPDWNAALISATK